MSDRPILFSAPMVRALKARVKTQTRRLAQGPVLKIAAGDRLWVRESFRLETNFDEMPPGILAGTNYTEMPVWHEADVGSPTAGAKSPWGHPWGRLRPGIHMPRWASRITLDVEAVRVEPLHAMTHEDARAEGVVFEEPQRDHAVASFAKLWDLINFKRAPWASNPDVAVISFSVRLEAIGPAAKAAA